MSCEHYLHCMNWCIVAERTQTNGSDDRSTVDTSARSSFSLEFCPNAIWVESIPQTGTGKYRLWKEFNTGDASGWVNAMPCSNHPRAAFPFTYLDRYALCLYQCSQCITQQPSLKNAVNKNTTQGKNDRKQRVCNDLLLLRRRKPHKVLKVWSFVQGRWPLHALWMLSAQE